MIVQLHSLGQWCLFSCIHYQNIYWWHYTTFLYYNMYQIVYFSWSAKRLQNYNCLDVVRVCVCACVRACVSVHDDYIKRRNIVNSQYVSISLYTRVNTPWGALSLTFDTPRALEQLHSWRHLLYLPNLSLKCNISITNCRIYLKLDVGVQHQKVHTSFYNLANRRNLIQKNNYMIKVISSSFSYTNFLT